MAHQNIGKGGTEEIPRKKRDTFTEQEEVREISIGRVECEGEPAWKLSSVKKEFPSTWKPEKQREICHAWKECSLHTGYRREKNKKNAFYANQKENLSSPLAKSSKLLDGDITNPPRPEEGMTQEKADPASEGGYQVLATKRAVIKGKRTNRVHRTAAKPKSKNKTISKPQKKRDLMCWTEAGFLRCPKKQGSVGTKGSRAGKRRAAAPHLKHRVKGKNVVVKTEGKRGRPDFLGRRRGGAERERTEAGEGCSSAR